MAGLNLHYPSGEVSLSAGTAKTPITVVAAANYRVKIKGIEVFFKGTSPTDTPAKIQFYRFTSDGTGSTGTLYNNNEDDSETIQTTGKIAYSAEPTLGNVFKIWEVHPQTGLVVYFPPGEEIVLKGGNKMGIQVTAAQNQTVSINLYLEE
ncbi:MAG: hypothetical protein FJ271_11865 [Planctomycetes bacterium]|nr:hypothetical protein [Planctomycetota bacterium]